MKNILAIPLSDDWMLVIVVSSLCLTVIVLNVIWFINSRFKVRTERIREQK